MIERAIKYLSSLLILISSPIFAQNELGSPYIKNYLPKEYRSSATIWDIAQDSDGLMYFGVAEGVLQYDGSDWQVIPVKNETTARSLDVDEKGVVYVGAKNEFGYLGKDSLQQPIYISLSDNLDEKHKEFADVWNVYSTNEGVFFLTFARIYRWYKNEMFIYEYDDITAHLGFYVNDNLYLILKKKGLYVFKENKFVPVPGGKHYIGKSIFSIFPSDKNQIIVLTRDSGLEIHNINTGEILPFENEVNEEIKSNKVYHGTISENNELVIATLKDGIFVINRKGKLVTHINEENGLQNNNVKYVFKDIYGGLWAGTAVGISYIDLNLPLTYFGTENGIIGFSRAIIRYNNILYVATGNSIYYLDENELNPLQKFKQIRYADGQFWSFQIFGNHLLVAGSQGLYEVNDKSIKTVKYLGNNSVFSILQSTIDSNRIYLALKKGIAIAKINSNNEVEITHKFRKNDIESNYLGEDKMGNLWVATAFDYLVKIENSSFDKEKGYPLVYKKIEYGEKLSSEGIIKINDKLFFTSKDGLLSIGKNDKLVLDSSINFEKLPKNFVIRRLKKDNNGNLWGHYHYKKISGQFLAIKTGDNSFKIKEDPFTRINEKISHINSPYIEDNGVVWFSGGEGIVRYDYNKDIGGRKNYSVNIRKIMLHSDSVILFGNNKKLNLDNFTFSFTNNATSFSFSAASYGNEKENKYQYYLEGYDEEWSEWSNKNTKEYNYLPEDNYVFRVRAKNIYNQISKEDHFTFVVLPPWYREKWAYFIYAISLIVIVYLIIKLATYRLLQSKNNLEKLVKERTTDITIEKEKVEKQKLLLEDVHHELSERNKDVMDSIIYAKRIQTSILPPIDKFKAEFKESFIFYQPRDIVSGDFYWFEKQGDYFVIACADCTGHGVPGAFMSMIGATLLNKIVEKKDINNCEDALTQLDIELHKALRQEENNERQNSMDGMDIALIALNLQENTCHFSGAFRPIYLVRDKELIVFNGNRISIGGAHINNKVFKGEDIKVNKGDQIYLFTDGITDQFGGEKNKKFKRDRLKRLLLENTVKPMDLQKKNIEEAFNNWKGSNEQLDDVLIIGVQIP